MRSRFFMQNFNDRVLKLIDHYTNGDKKAFSEKTGIKYSTLVEYCSGKKTDPKMSFLSRIVLTYRDVDAFWLITGITKETYSRYPITAESGAVYDTATLSQLQKLEIQVESYEKVFKLMGLNRQKL
jgi:hypothetical protein